MVLRLFMTAVLSLPASVLGEPVLPAGVFLRQYAWTVLPQRPANAVCVSDNAATKFKTVDAVFLVEDSHGFTLCSIKGLFTLCRDWEDCNPRAKRAYWPRHAGG